jgi:hypothetical protein
MCVFEFTRFQFWFEFSISIEFWFEFSRSMWVLAGRGWVLGLGLEMNLSYGGQAGCRVLFSIFEGKFSLQG